MVRRCIASMSFDWERACGNRFDLLVGDAPTWAMGCNLDGLVAEYSQLAERYRAEGDGDSSEKSHSLCGHSHISTFFEWSTDAR